MNNKETVKEFIIRLLSEQHKNELEGKGYDFYFVLRTELDNLNTTPTEPKLCSGSMVPCVECQKNYCNGCFKKCPDCFIEPKQEEKTIIGKTPLKIENGFADGGKIEILKNPESPRTQVAREIEKLKEWFATEFCKSGLCDRKDDKIDKFYLDTYHKLDEITSTYLNKEEL